MLSNYLIILEKQIFLKKNLILLNIIYTWDLVQAGKAEQWITVRVQTQPTCRMWSISINKSRIVLC